MESLQKQTEQENLSGKIQSLYSELSSLKEKIRASTQDKHVLDLSTSISLMMERLINKSMISIRKQLSQKIIENLQQIYRKDRRRSDPGRYERLPQAGGSGKREHRKGEPVGHRRTL